LYRGAGIAVAWRDLAIHGGSRHHLPVRCTAPIQSHAGAARVLERILFRRDLNTLETHGLQSDGPGAAGVGLYGDTVSLTN